MLNETTAARIRSEISDFHTQNVSEYTPSGLVGISEYAFSILMIESLSVFSGWL